MCFLLQGSLGPKAPTLQTGLCAAGAGVSAATTQPGGWQKQTDPAARGDPRYPEAGALEQSPQLFLVFMQFLLTVVEGNAAVLPGTGTRTWDFLFPEET